MDAETLSTIILLGSFLIMVGMRFPIAYAVGISTVLCMISMGLNLVTLPQQMVKGVWSFSLMAVPFFITMGVLMGTGGISDKLIALANSLVGWMRGGLAMVNIVASYFFGGISGSAAADTASLGSILIPMMVDEGYDADFSTAVTITSSCEGLLVPPSHNMVIYAMTAGGVSVGALFMAGYLPGALLAIALMIGSYILSVKRNYPKGEKFSLKAFGKQLVKSFWALAAVLIVVVGRFALPAYVPLYQVHLLYRDKDSLFPCILQVDVVPLRAGGLDAVYTDETADSIVYVDYIVPLVKLHKGVYRTALNLFHRCRGPFLATEYLVLLDGDYVAVGEDKAAGDCTHYHLYIKVLKYLAYPLGLDTGA